MKIPRLWTELSLLIELLEEKLVFLQLLLDVEGLREVREQGRQFPFGNIVSVRKSWLDVDHLSWSAVALSEVKAVIGRKRRNTQTSMGQDGASGFQAMLGSRS